MNDQEEYIEYIRNRKSSFKRNFYKESLKEMETFREKYPECKPKILLHACCVVCACWPMDFLHDAFDITLIYNNPNIWPKPEYDKRLSELKRYLHERWNDEIGLIVTDYSGEEYMDSLAFGKDDPEGKRKYAHYVHHSDSHAPDHDIRQARSAFCEYVAAVLECGKSRPYSGSMDQDLFIFRFEHHKVEKQRYQFHDFLYDRRDEDRSLFLSHIAGRTNKAADVRGQKAHSHSDKGRDHESLGIAPSKKRCDKQRNSYANEDILSIYHQDAPPSRAHSTLMNKRAAMNKATIVDISNTQYIGSALIYMQLVLHANIATDRLSSFMFFVVLPVS